MKAAEMHKNEGMPSLATDSMKERFQGLWTRCLRPEGVNDAKAIWMNMEAHYTEPHRHYHDKQHLAHCLKQLDLAAEHIGQPDQVEMAIWFHDVINEPSASDNEARSAAFFRYFAEGAMDEPFISAVVDLILATTHRVAPEDLDQQFICDIDLASFGCPWECYLRDTMNLQAEFPGSDEDFYTGKRTFLRALLARDRIFQTDFFFDRYETQARENIRGFFRLFDQRSC